jgi:hypothetical protein
MDATGINVTLSPSLHRATITFEGVVGIGVLAPENIGFDLHARIVSGDIVAPILAVGIEPLAGDRFPVRSRSEPRSIQNLNGNRRGFMKVVM